MEAAKGGKKGGKKGGNPQQQQKKQPQQQQKKGQAAPAAAKGQPQQQQKKQPQQQQKKQPQQQQKKDQAAAAPAAAPAKNQKKNKGQAAAAAKEEKAVVPQPPAKKAKADEEQQAEIAELSEEAQKELSALADEFNKLADEEMKAVAKITREFNGKRKPLLEKRKQVIGKIPGFWLQALANTPAAGLINDNDAEVFQYLKDITVVEPTLDEADKAKSDDDFKIIFTFDKNPFFSNKQLWKEVKYVGEGEEKELKVTGSPINWNKGKNPAEKKKAAEPAEAGKQKGKRTLDEVDDEDEDEGSFFEWFSSTEDETVELGEWFRDKFVPQAVGYFMGDVSDDEDEDDFDSEDEAEFARLAGLDGGDDDEDDDEEDGDE